MSFTRLFERKDELLALLFLAISSVLSLSFFSFSPHDPSFSSKQILMDGGVNNLCGYLGSFSSDIFFQVFGVGAWGWVFFSFWMFWLYLTKKEVSIEKSLFFINGIIIFCLGVSLFKSFYLYDGLISGGGILGKGLYAFLYPLVSTGGVLLFIFFSCLITFLVFSDKSLQEAPVHFGSKFSGAFSGLVSGLTSKLSMPTFFRRSSNPEHLEQKLEEAIPVVPSFKLPTEEAKVNSEGPSFAIPKISRTEQSKSIQINRMEKSEEDWDLPTLDLFDDPPVKIEDNLEEEIQKKAKLLTTKLEQFNVRGQITGIRTGPCVTLFEFKPNVDVKISKITELADDLSMALACESVRIIAPIPGRDVVGIETSNSKRDTVYLKEILGGEQFWDEEIKIPLAVGRKADGLPLTVDLRKMPHLLVAGSTGSGKSVFVVSTITSLLMRYSPNSLRLIMIDPKQVDLAAFEDLPHLLMPIIKQPKQAITSLKWAITEMDKRYRSMAKFGARNLEDYNKFVEDLDEEAYAVHEEVNETAEVPSYYYESLPYIVIIVEEFGDLMAVDKSNVEQAVVRLAQMARASGIHLILAMQSPRKDVVTGLIKTNIPGRISFKVASKMDSRIILDEGGGERLLSRGDMLFVAPGVSKPIRAHGSWAPEEDIESLVEFWKEQGEPEYFDISQSEVSGGDGMPGGGSGEEFDERYDEILAYVSRMKTVSA